MRPTVILIFAALLLAGCDSSQEAKVSPPEVSQSTQPAPVPPQEEPSKAPAAPPVSAPRPAGDKIMTSTTNTPAVRTRIFLKDAVEPALVEYPTAALPLWREVSHARPTLVLLSNDPFLQPVPPQLRKEADLFLREADAQELRARTRPWAPGTLLMPAMAVDAALRSGFFGKVVWVLPTEAKKEDLSVEAIRKQMRDFGALDEKEAATLRLEGGAFSGTIRGVPWTVVPLSELKGVDGPTVVHIDLAFLRALYRNEIKTPLHPLVGSVFRALREAKLQTCAATLSLSQLTRQVPLETRFLGETMAAIVRNPSILDGPLPRKWERRGEIFYLQNFFEKERINRLALAMEKDDPRDPAVHYALYQSYREMKDGDKALAALDRAVSLDKGYALEYLDLTEVAREKGRPDEALRMFALAEKAWPDNPFITLAKARFLVETGKGKEALPLLARLKKLPWSPVYQGDMEKLLQEGEAKARLSPDVASVHPAVPGSSEEREK